MTTGKNGGSSRLLGALASRLAIAETDVFHSAVPPFDHAESLSNLASHLLSEADADTAESGGKKEPLAFAARAGSTTAAIMQPEIAQSGIAPSDIAASDIAPPEILRNGIGLTGAGNGAVSEQEKSSEQASERPASERQPVLAGKTAAVIGFSPADAALLGSALAAQSCSVLILSHEEAEFKKSSITGCDLLLMQARLEWGEPGVLYRGSALKTKRPALILGCREALSTAALWTHGGPREFVPAPWVAEDILWRAATLLVRMEAAKTRRTKKSGRKLVIIGDADTATSTLLHAILAQQGVDCQLADNGVTALVLAKSKQADAVMVDVSLPGLDGFEVLAELKRDPAMSNTVTILLTSHQTEADVLRGFGLGADDYITKPFSAMEVVARLKRFLLRKH